MSVLPMNGFSMFIEWTRPPSDAWNGILKGYHVKIKSEDNSYMKSININGDVVYTNIDDLIPDTLYIVDVCAYTAAGIGPCLRSFNRTHVSRKSLSVLGNISIAYLLILSVTLSVRVTLYSVCILQVILHASLSCSTIRGTCQCNMLEQNVIKQH